MVSPHPIRLLVAGVYKFANSHFGGVRTAPDHVGRVSFACKANGQG